MSLCDSVSLRQLRHDRVTEVDFREELPRHPTGKLYKRLLQQEEYAKRGVVPPWETEGRQR
jgi:acyl-coenzyme A synthetase/AMP-(fatty) acid ligase